MQRNRQADPAVSSSAAALSEDLKQVLQALRRRITERRDPGRYLALVHLVEGLSLAEWQKIAAGLDERDWLALPLDTADGLPLQALQDTLEELAYQRDHDILTGLANRRMFDRVLSAEMQRSMRTKTDLSLLLLDLDNFKSVNDTYGHLVGDQVLIRLGEILRHSIRPYDLAARVGGEEFCLILPGASSWRAQNLGKRILKHFQSEIFSVADGISFSMAFSAGTSTASCYTSPIDCQELYTQADNALYLAKRHGKSRVATAKSGGPVTENPALVRPDEKLFLFNGGH